jgi:hypothetical protein
MKRFWRNEHHDVEAELRRYRPEPRPEFLAALGADLDRRRRRPMAVRRTALAAALTVAMLSVFAAFGGIGYASSAAKDAIQVTKVGKLVGISSDNSSQSQVQSNGTENNPTEGQYRPGKGCGDKNHVHLRENECKNPPK